jgi:hypothetical protein
MIGQAHSIFGHIDKIVMGAVDSIYVIYLIQGARTVQMFCQIELCFPERRRFLKLRVEVDEIIGLYFLQRLILYQFFKLETDFFRAVGSFFLLLLAEVEGLIVFEMRGFGVGVRF